MQLLREEYAHFITNPQLLLEKIDCLNTLHSPPQLDHWRTLVMTERWGEFVLDLLINHYDPAYQRSTLKHYPQLEQATRVETPDSSARGFQQLAQQFLAQTHAN